MDISIRIAAIVRVLEQATDMIKALDGDISNMDKEKVLDVFEAIDDIQGCDSMLEDAIDSLQDRFNDPLLLREEGEWGEITSL